MVFYSEDKRPRHNRSWDIFKDISYPLIEFLGYIEVDNKQSFHPSEFVSQLLSIFFKNLLLFLSVFLI